MRQRRGNELRSVPRRGAALVVAIVCVSIAIAVMYGLAQLATQAYREVDLETRRTQARWIMESGVDRAAAQLAEDTDYVGEQWSIPAAELGGRYDGQVQIRVEPVEGEANWRQIRVVADYPVELPQRVRRTREIRMPLHP